MFRRSGLNLYYLVVIKPLITGKINWKQILRLLKNARIFIDP